MPAADLDEAIASVAKLAAVPENNRAKFARFVKSAVREADNRGPGQQPRVRNVKPRLIKLRAALARARSVLNSMVPASDRNRQPDYRGEVAGTYLSAVSSRSISDWIEDVDKAIRAASRIPKTKHSVGRSSTANLAFSLFTHQLLTAAHVCEGSLILYRGDTTGGVAKGSFERALAQLKNHLPDDFIPKSESGIDATFKRAAANFRRERTRFTK